MQPAPSTKNAGAIKPSATTAAPKVSPGGTQGGKTQGAGPGAKTQIERVINSLVLSRAHRGYISTLPSKQGGIRV